MKSEKNIFIAFLLNLAFSLVEFFGGKFHFPEKNRYLADFAPGDFEKILAKSGRGGSGGGACSPVHQTVKKSF